MTTPRLPSLLEEAEAIRAGAAARAPFLEGASLAGIGWATVELERAARELDPAGTWTVAPRDTLLGASCWLASPTEPGTEAADPALLLLEPDTEGRLAASLVRFSEGVAAIYIRPTAAAAATNAVAASGPRLSAADDGPLGTGRVLLGGPAWGPHVIVLEAGVIT